MILTPDGSVLQICRSEAVKRYYVSVGIAEPRCADKIVPALSLNVLKFIDFNVRRYFSNLRSSLEVPVVRSIRQRRSLPWTYIRLSFRTSQLTL